MKTSRTRRLAGSLAVLWALMQPLSSSNALLGALSLVASHGHDVSILADSGHVDLVLSHTANGASDERHLAEQHLHSGAVSEGGHVVHLTSADVLRDSMRRGGQVDAQGASFMLPLHWSPLPVRTHEPQRERSEHRPPLFQMVVLRI